MRKFDFAGERAFKNFMKYVCNCRLSAVVVDFYAVKSFKYLFVCLCKGNEYLFESFSELEWTGYVPFIHKHALVPEINLAGKSHHSCEDSFA